jgi:hypothetical protein
MGHDGYPLVLVFTNRSRPMHRHTVDLGYPANCSVLFLSMVSVSVFCLFVYSPPHPPSVSQKQCFSSVAGVCPRRSDYGLSVLACLTHLYPSTSHMTYYCMCLHSRCSNHSSCTGLCNANVVSLSFLIYSVRNHCEIK